MAMVAHRGGRRERGGGPSQENGNRMSGLEPHVERMGVCERGMHSKLPVKLEEDLFSKMNTLPHFYSQ